MSTVNRFPCRREAAVIVPGQLGFFPASFPFFATASSLFAHLPLCSLRQQWRLTPLRRVSKATPNKPTETPTGNLKQYVYILAAAHRLPQCLTLSSAQRFAARRSQGPERISSSCRIGRPVAPVGSFGAERESLPIEATPDIS